MATLLRSHWQIMAIALPLIVIIVALVIVQPWSSSPDSQSVLGKAYAANSDINSYRMSFSGTSEGSDGFNSQQSMDVEYVSHDRYHVRMTENGQPEEFIIIGDEQYIGSGSPSAVVMSTFANGFSGILSQEAPFSILDSLTDIQRLAEGKIDGETCLHYLGSFDIEKQIAETRRSLMEAQAGMGVTPSEEEINSLTEPMRQMKMEYELWIGKADYLFRQIKINGQVPDDSEGVNFVKVNIAMKYYDINSPISIEPPLDASGGLLSGWRAVPDAEKVHLPPTPSSPPPRNN